MGKPVFVDYETKIYAAYLNAVAATVWDAIGQATNPQDARHFIGAVEEAPQNGSSYARQNAQWVQIQVGNLHNDLTGRSAADAHPISAITNLQTSLDQINTSLSGKAPTSAGTASGTSFSPTGTVAATNVQSAIAEVSGDVTALQATVSGLGTPAASAVTFSPTGTVAATNVQAAIAEVASEKVALSGGTMTGNLTGTNFLAPKNQVGVSATPANNFTLDASTDNGTMKLARNSGQDIMTVDAAGKVAFPVGASIKGGTVAPAAGQVGEILSATASQVLTTGSSQTVATLALTAGVWDVDGEIIYTSGGTHNLTRLCESISLTTNTQGGSIAAAVYASQSYNPSGTGSISRSAPLTRVVLSAPASVYLIAYPIFSSAGLTGQGAIRARRAA